MAQRYYFFSACDADTLANGILVLLASSVSAELMGWEYGASAWEILKPARQMFCRREIDTAW